MADAALLTIPLVFLAGVVSFASPCFLPVVPVFVGYLVGSEPGAGPMGPAGPGSHGGPAARRSAATQAMAFVLGFTLIFVTLWASLGLLGHLLADYRAPLRVLGGAILIVLGLHAAALIDIPLLQRQRGVRVATILRRESGRAHRHHETSGPAGAPAAPAPGGQPAGVRVGAPAAAISTPPAPSELSPSHRRALLLGLAFGAGWTPCIGPILGGVIGLASVSDSLLRGSVLLLTYCFGLGLPFVLVAVGATEVHHRMRRLAAHHTTISLVSGALLALLGFAMITDLYGRITGLAPTFGL